MCNSRDRLRSLLTKYYRDVRGLPNWKEAIEKRIENGLDCQLERLQAFVSLEGKCILDVGCGFGDLLMALESDASVELAVGIDPDTDWAQEAGRRIDSDSSAVGVAVGERLPFPDGVFDGVCSNYVVEHVKDLDKMLAEMIRVCAPGGWCYINGPNYLIPYEGHYRMMFLPWLPKRLAGWWLERCGRDPSYLYDDIYYVNPFTVIKTLRRLGVRSELNVMQQSIARPDLFASGFVRKWAKRISWVPWPSWLIYLLLPDFSVIVWKPSC